MRNQRFVPSFGLLSAFILLACGSGAGRTEGGEEGPSTASTATASTSGAEGGAEPAESEWPAWADMDRQQRGAYMQQVVVPEMNELFANAGISGLPSSVSCPTCHGEDAQEVGFRMPNALHPLNPSQIPALFASEDPEVQRVALFMAGPVEHRMAELLGQEAYDPETGEGFGCLNCHATAPVE